MIVEYRKLEDNKTGSLRIVIPKDMAIKLNIKKGDNIKIMQLTNSLILRKADN